jgi:ribosomal protein S18 acetylase RimI-like enzyme
LDNRSVTIRPYKTGDAGAVIGVMREVFVYEHGWTTAFLREAVRTLRKMLMTMIPARELFLVCESREGLCGVMFLKSMENDTAIIRWLAVKRKYRGLGIGRRLIEMALEFSREAGYTKVKLNTVSGLDRAMKTYLKAGFVKTGEKEQFAWNMDIKIHYMEIYL